MNNEQEKGAVPPETTKPVFYLDWNVISYLHDPSHLEYERKATLVCLREILELIDRSSMITPYSYAHLADIRQGPRDHHTSWLTYLESTSGGWKVIEMPGNRDRIALFRTASVFDDFSEYDSDQREFESRQSVYEKLSSAAFEPVRAEILRQIEKIEKNPNAKILKHVAQMLSGETKITGLQIMRFNKMLRNSLRDQVGARVRYPGAKHMIKAHPNKAFKQIVDESISKSNLPWSSFEELKQAIPFVGTAGFLSPFMERVNRLSIIANMFGIGLEKLKKETAFTGLVNDLGHLSFGLRCHYLVSEDSALTEKAVFIKNMIGLPVVVLGAEGLNRLLLSQVASYYINQKSGNANDGTSEVIFRFTGQNGEAIRTYAVNPDEPRVDDESGI